MKTLKEHLNESLNEAKVRAVSGRTFGEFIAWMNGYWDVKNKTTKSGPDNLKYSAEGPFENGGFDSFKTEKEMYSFILKNKNVKLNTIRVTETPNDLECQLTINGINLVIATIVEPFEEID